MNELRIAQIKNKIVSMKAVFETYVGLNRHPQKVERRKAELEGLETELERLEAKSK